MARDGRSSTCEVASPHILNEQLRTQQTPHPVASLMACTGY